MFFIKAHIQSTHNAFPDLRTQPIAPAIASTEDPPSIVFTRARISPGIKILLTPNHRMHPAQIDQPNVQYTPYRAYIPTRTPTKY